MSQPTAVVTGAAGFLGRHVARLLSSQGWRVVGLGRGKWDENAWRAWGLSAWRCQEVSLERLAALNETPQAMFHCAGSGSVSAAFADPHAEFQNTVGSTLAALEYLRLHCPEGALIYPSSASVYGEVSQLPIAENHPVQPISPYGRYKVMGEELCKEYGRHFGIRSARLRFFSLYGPGLDKQLLFDACVKAASGNYDFFGSGEELRDWLHVADAARLMLLAVEHAGASSPVANGATGIGRTVREALVLLLNFLGAPQGPVFPGVAKPGNPKHYVANVSVISSWPFAPSIDFRDGLREFAAAFLNSNCSQP